MRRRFSFFLLKTWRGIFLQFRSSQTDSQSSLSSKQASKSWKKDSFSSSPFFRGTERSIKMGLGLLGEAPEEIIGWARWTMQLQQQLVWRRRRRKQNEVKCLKVEKETISSIWWASLFDYLLSAVSSLNI